MKRHRQNVQNSCAYGKRCRHKTAADRARDVQEAQKMRRDCLHQAAQALRIYREFRRKYIVSCRKDTAERMRFWEGIYLFWLNEYEEDSRRVMAG